MIPCGRVIMEKKCGLQLLWLFVIKRLSPESPHLFFFSFYEGYMLTVLTNIDSSLFLNLFLYTSINHHDVTLRRNPTVFLCLKCLQQVGNT